jgi:putative tricarboxylic transport membrane protein
VSPTKLATRKVDAAASVFFFTLAVAVAIEGVRLGAGWDDRGPDSGFFPFWLAVLMGFGALASFVQALRSRRDEPFMEHRQEVVDLAKVGIPLIVTVIAIPWTGIYIATLLYVSIFAWWYGGFRWWSALFAGVCFAGFLYLALARTMRISMPMSVFYEKGILPF